MGTKATTRGKRFELRKARRLEAIQEGAILAADTLAVDTPAADIPAAVIRGDPGAAVVAGAKAEAQEIAAGTSKTIRKSSRSFVLAHRSSSI